MPRTTTPGDAWTRQLFALVVVSANLVCIGAISGLAAEDNAGASWPRVSICQVPLRLAAQALEEEWPPLPTATSGRGASSG